MAQIALYIKKYQIHSSLIMILGFAGSGALLIFVYLPHAFLPFVSGLFLGYIIQRSRFCFAACFRDVFMLGNTALTRALLVVLALTTAGFSLLNATSGQFVLEASGRVYPLGLHTLVGGFIFGFGMVIAGSCVSGCLVRMGEGYLMQWSTLAGLLLGSLFGAMHLDWWLRPEMFSFSAIFLPRVLGWPIALMLQFSLIVALYLLAMKIEKSRDLWGIFKVTGATWPYGVGAVLLGLGNVALLSVWGRPWGVTSGLTHFSGWVGLKLGIPVMNWTYFARASEKGLATEEALLSHPLLFLALAMIIGGFLASVRHHEFRIRRPRTAKYSYFALAGGILMGYGSRLAFGCNIGALLSGIGSLSLHGWLFFFAILPGAFLGGKALIRYVMT